MTITVYSTTTCPYCKKLKDYLSTNNISFIEKLVDIDESSQKEMEEISGGFLGIPFSSITKDDGTKDSVIGFDKGKLDAIFKL